MSEETSNPEREAPLLRVVSPHATPEEVAALVAVLASLGGGSAPAPRRTPEWQASHRRLREPHRPGPGAWRASGLPR
jgi:hypothetical protein